MRVTYSQEKKLDAQLRAVSASYNELYAQACTQLEEHKRFLKVTLIAEINHGEGVRDPAAVPELTQLTLACDSVTLGVVKIEPGVSGSSVSVVYEYPDELYAYLTRDNLPNALRDVLKDGQVLPDTAKVQAQ